jgi:hypothetical protein
VRDRLKYGLPRFSGAPLVDQPEAGVEVSLEENVDMDIRAQVAAGPDVPGVWINLIVCERALSILHRKP